MRLKSYSPSDSGTVLVNGTSDTGYSWRSQGMEAGAFGAPSWEALFSQPGFFGSPIRVGRRENTREFTLTFRLDDSTTTGLGSQVETLGRQVQLVNEYGGRLRYRPQGFTYAVEFEVLNIAIGPSMWSHAAEAFYRQDVELTFTVEPWAYPDSMRILDTFDTDTSTTGGIYNNGGADWTAQTGALTNATWGTGGYVAASANLATENKWLHTGTPHTFKDPVVGIVCDQINTSGFKCGAILKWVDANNYIEAYIDNSGGTRRLRVDVILANVRSNRYSATPTGERVRIVAGMHGGRITLVAQVSEENPLIASGGSIVYTLTSAEKAVFEGVASRVGIVWTPTTSDATLYAFDASEGYLSPQLAMPYQNRLNATIGPAADFSLEFNPDLTGSGSAGLVEYLAFAWWNRPRNYNYVHEQFPRSTTRWSAAVVAGVQTNAGTSVAASSSVAYRGSTAAQATLTTVTAATDAGSTWFCGRLFRQGHTYRFRVACKLNSGSGSILARAGVSGDVASGSASALSSSWAYYTVDWTPTADRYGAYIAMVTSSSVTVSWQAMDIQFYELNTGDSAPEVLQGGFIPYGFLPSIGYEGKGAYFTSSADASAFGGGPLLSGSGATASNAQIIWPIITHPLNEPTGFVDVDYWVSMKVQSTVTGLTANLWFNSSSLNVNTPVQYAFPLGASATKAMAAPSASTVRRLFYLGRMRIPADAGDEQRHLLLQITATGGGTVAVDGLLGYPVRGQVSTVSGVGDADVSIPFSSTLLGGRISPDLAMYSLQAQDSGASRTEMIESIGGVGGNRLQTAPGMKLEGMYVQSDAMVPDGTDSSSDSIDVQYTPMLRLLIQPKHFITAGA